MASTETYDIPSMKLELSEKEARGHLNTIMGIILITVLFHHHYLRPMNWQESSLEAVLAAGDALFLAGAALFVTDASLSYLRAAWLHIRIELLLLFEE